MDIQSAAAEAVLVANRLLEKIEKKEEEDKKLTAIGKNMISKLVDKEYTIKKKAILDNLYDQLNITIRKYNSIYSQNASQQSDRAPLISKKDNRAVPVEDCRETFFRIQTLVSTAYREYSQEEVVRNKRSDDVSVELHSTDIRIALLADRLPMTEKISGISKSSSSSSGCCIIL
eukprot:TRINITY_DN3867_c0_g1_i1.p1 TRINITY_DN3867_c0_g1~~TRINITY_DN3867_c0_g1_i1.p1  ORF type:complete len:174 (-),score=33.68 TRINITY_DN3867_c0_g1_i1:227-748(-)